MVDPIAGSAWFCGCNVVALYTENIEFLNILWFHLNSNTICNKMHFQQPEYKTLNIGFLELDHIFMKTSQSGLEFPNESDVNVFKG